MQWMAFLNNGATAGKIPCPNDKCSAKLGNFDWSGLQCGCGEWVTPVSLYFT
jgi:dual specificity phosphatase 12